MSLRFILPAFVALSLTLPASAQPSSPPGFWQGFQLSTEASGAWVENLSRSSNPLDMREATVYDLGLDATRTRQIARDWLVSYGAEANGFLVPDYSRNNLFTYAANARLQRKFGLGPYAPSLAGQVSYGRTEARIDGQDGGTLSGGFSFAKRLHPAFQISLDATWLRHYAEHATFDLSQRTYTIEAAWDISDRWRLTASAGLLEGDIVATAGPAVWARALSGGLGPAIADYYNRTPWKITDAYGPGWVSYSVKADVDLWAASLSYAFSERTTLDLRLRSAYAVNIVNVRYLQRHWGAAIVHRF